MRRISVLMGLFVLTVASANPQILSKASYLMNRDSSSMLGGNAIIDILADDGTIWVGAEDGLHKTTDDGLSWATYDHSDNLGRGGVSAIAIRNGVVWAATAYDTIIETIIESQELPVGGGLSYSTDGGGSWTYIPQPGVTPIQGLTYDIALTDSTIWLACFSQSLQFSSDNGSTWTTRVPDEHSWDPYIYLSHRVFSVITTDEAIWVGTAGGIHRSGDGGQTWMNMNHENAGISGDFVVALAEQQHEGTSTIWAATWKAEGPTEYYGVSKTEDGGLTWRVCLEGEFVHNFAFDGPAVYAATDNGLKKSTDGGQTWHTFPQIVDESTGETIDCPEMYSVRAHEGLLWAGSCGGLAMTDDDGLTWTIFRFLVSVASSESVPHPDGFLLSQNYPNPFNPSTTIQFTLPGERRTENGGREPNHTTLKIYNLLGQEVRTLVDEVKEAGYYTVTWDGTDLFGKEAASGMYFYQLQAGEFGVTKRMALVR